MFSRLSRRCAAATPYLAFEHRHSECDRMSLHGGIDSLTHRRIVGWGWESGAPDVAVVVLVCLGNRVHGRMTANMYREDLEVAGYGLGFCGFDLAFPANLLKPREGYEVAVRVEGSGLHLPGSPYGLGPAVRVVR